MTSSLLCQFLQISIIAIGTLLMIVPNSQSLECYQYSTKNASTAMGGRAAWELNKMFTLVNGQENPLVVSIGNGHPTKQCSADYNFCATIHCTKIYGVHTVKGCIKVTGSQDPARTCRILREYCAGDSKFYCRFCNTDRCNVD